MTSNPIEEMIQAIENAECCTFCGMHSFSSAVGEPCLCCGKSLLGRQLRSTTCDPSRLSYTEPNDDCVMSDATSRLNQDGVSNPLPIRKPVFKRSNTKPKSSITTACGKPGDEVLSEFEELLKRDGFQVGGNADGTARKYARYMKMLFDHDIFRSRVDFFQADSREKAHAFYRRFALATASEKGGKTSASKLFSNFKNGFDKFVMLAHFESEFKPVETPACGSSDEQEALITELLAFFG